MFGFHPVNLAFRLVLEISALVALGAGAYAVGSGPVAWLLAIAVPLIAALAWGTFNVPGDESRSGKAPVVVPGAIRLIIELALFATAVGMVFPVSPLAALPSALPESHHWSVVGLKVGRSRRPDGRAPATRSNP